MKKAIILSVGYIVLRVILIVVNNRLNYWMGPISNNDEVIRINMISFLIGSIGLIYLVVALLRRVKVYPALIWFVVLIITSQLMNLLSSTIGQYFYGAFIPILYFRALLFIAYLGIGIMMVSRKAWPVMVSVVLFYQLPSIILSTSIIFRNFVNYLYVNGWLENYMIINKIFFFIGIGLTGYMLFMIYYDKDQMNYMYE